MDTVMKTVTVTVSTPNRYVGSQSGNPATAIEMPSPWLASNLYEQIQSLKPVGPLCVVLSSMQQAYQLSE